LKPFNIDNNGIDFAKDTIWNVLSFKHLNKIYNALGIVCKKFSVGETGKQHSPKKYGLK
jgi:hypothetical protein